MDNIVDLGLEKKPVYQKVLSGIEEKTGYQSVLPVDDDSYEQISPRNSIQMETPSETFSDPYLNDVKNRMKQRLTQKYNIDFKDKYNNDKLIQYLNDRKTNILNKKPVWYKLWKYRYMSEDRLNALVENFRKYVGSELDDSISDSEYKSLNKRLLSTPF